MTQGEHMPPVRLYGQVALVTGADRGSARPLPWPWVRRWRSARDPGDEVTGVAREIAPGYPLRSESIKPMSARTTRRTVGVLFLLAYVVYLADGAVPGAGSASTVVLSHIASHQLQISAGALLMLANSAAVIGFGVLIFPILKRHHESSAYGYLTVQVAQGLMLAVGIVFLLLRIPLAQQYTSAHGNPAVPALAQVAQEANHYAFWISMLAVAAGSLLLCRVLLNENLVPRFLAVYGLTGYAVFLAGAILEILGHNVGVALSIPGGLFEIAFGILLIARGFPAAQSSDYDGLARNVRPANDSTIERAHPLMREGRPGFSLRCRQARSVAVPTPTECSASGSGQRISTQINHICAARSATPAKSTLRQIGGSCSSPGRGG
jgi:hypothetical protein